MYFSILVSPLCVHYLWKPMVHLPFTKKGVILMWCWYDILGGYVKTEEVSRDFDTRILNKVYKYMH